MGTTELTLSHKAAQNRIGSQTITRLRPLWRLLDGSSLDATTERWLAACIAVIQDQRQTSAALAALYVDQFKKATLGVAARPVLAGAAPIEALATSLLVTGPLSVKSAVARGVPLVRAMSVAEASSSAAAVRHAMNAGRETITASVAADPAGRGWRRVTSGRACKFCQMLAGRGAVYSADTADFQCHDGCNCSAEPVYR